MPWIGSGRAHRRRREAACAARRGGCCAGLRWAGPKGARLASAPWNGCTPRGDASRPTDLLRAEIVAIGVTGALASDDSHADTQGNSLDGALDDRFVNAKAAGGQVFEVQIGVIAAGGQSLVEIRLEVVLGDAELLPEEGIG